MEKRSFKPEELQAVKSFPIVGILEKNGLQAVRQDAKGFWFFSPFRQEKTPSFLVDKQNHFYDFGAGFGGDVIKLLCELQKISFVEAVKQLLENRTFFFASPETPQTEASPIKPQIESIKPLQGKFFRNYIESRKIDFEIAKEYLQAIFYKLRPEQAKCYFGIGMANTLQGYEIKNIQKDKYYCLGTKAPTLIDKGQSKYWSIFEGMFDFLACLTYYQKPIQTNVLILHSASQARKATSLIPDEASKIFLFLDNDQAGDQASEIFATHFGGHSTLKDCRDLYKNYKDFNDFLLLETLSSDTSFQDKNAVSSE